jgi:hypothetical protein
LIGAIYEQLLKREGTFVPTKEGTAWSPFFKYRVFGVYSMKGGRRKVFVTEANMAS